MKTRREIIELIEIYVQKKIEENEKIIKFSFFEVRVKMDIPEAQDELFIELCQNKLENIGYTVYLEGERFIFENANRMVQDNEVIIGIKKI